jgi:hypothetical protein
MDGQMGFFFSLISLKQIILSKNYLTANLYTEAEGQSPLIGHSISPSSCYASSIAILSCSHLADVHSNVDSDNRVVTLVTYA